MSAETGPRTVRAYVGLGANVGDPARTLEAAIHALGALPGARLAGVSRLYLTSPVGGVDQPDFHNAVVALDVPAGPDPETAALALLVTLKGLERALGRRDRERWGPRELDLDLLLFDDLALRVERPDAARSDDPAKGAVQWLEVPHPRAANRLFVLAPLAELAPDVVPPEWPASIAALRDEREAAEGPDAVRAVARWSDGWTSV